jgi:NADH-quinone oxidoreductase subunit L
MLAAYAKSAQLPMHTWLPDAMEGPTPVSALIHAATMVTAGVYLLVRSSMFLQLLPDLASAVAYLGVATALFAACCAMVQTDLKRVLAYSTMSQLGYMFLAVGVGAYGAAIFHLVTHAFFKALLFLTAGIVIHAAHGEQDMRKLGGLGKQMPVAAVLFGVGGACLSGVPFTSGFFSKESILHAAHESPNGTGLFLIGALVAVMTAFYTGRAFFLTFMGPQRIAHPHLPGAPMTGACAVLMCLSLGAGGLYPDLQGFLDPTRALSAFEIDPGGASLSVIVLSGLVVVALLAAYGLFGKGAPDRLGGDTLIVSSLRGGLGFDDFYGFISRGVDLMGRLGAKGADRFFQDGLPDLIGRSFNGLSYALKEVQTGQTRFYMAVLTLFVAVLLFFTLVLHGGSLQ